MMPTVYMNHSSYQAGLKTKSDAELRFIRNDAHEAMKANPTGAKAGYYADEICYCSMELARRQQSSGKLK